MASAAFEIPNNVNLAESRQPQIWASAITTLVLAVVAVGLRFLSRRLNRFTYGLDDWLVVAALFPLTGGLAVDIYWVKHGLGNHVELAGSDVLPHFLKGLFLGWIFYVLTICTVKYSILALYWRIFQLTSIRVPIWILTAVTTGWGVSVILVTIFQCSPVSAFWDRKAGSQCNIDLFAFFVSITVINTLADIVILALPIPFVMKMSRNFAQKAVVCALFLSGSCVVVISMARLAYLCTYNIANPDVTWESAPIAIWSMPECAVAVISGCLPCLRPVCLLVTGRLPRPHETNPRAQSPVDRATFPMSEISLRPVGSVSSRCGKLSGSGGHAFQNHTISNGGNQITETQRESDGLKTQAACEARSGCWSESSSLGKASHEKHKPSDASDNGRALNITVQTSFDTDGHLDWFGRIDSRTPRDVEGAHVEDEWGR